MPSVVIFNLEIGDTVVLGQLPVGVYLRGSPW